MRDLFKPPSTEIPARLLLWPLQEAGQYQWILVEHRAGREAGRGSLEQAAGVGEELPAMEVVLVLPAGDVALRTMPISEAERKLYRQMLPFAMEDGLIESTDELQFAYRPVDDDHMGVAWIGSSKLQQRLDEIRSAGLGVDVVLPEPMLLPWSEEQQTWVLHNQVVVARTGACAGFGVAAEAVEMVASLPDKDGDSECKRVLLVAERNAESEQVMAAIAASGREPVLQPVDDLMAWQAGVLPDELFTLLQGEFKPPLRLRHHWREWKPVAIVCLAALLLNYGVLLYHYWNAKQRAENLQAEKFALVREVIPTGRISSPERQLRAAMAQQNQSGPTRFGAMLAAIGPVLTGEAGYTVRTLNYDSVAQSLRLEVRTTDFQHIEKFRGQMQERGLQAELLNSSAQGKGILARLELKEGAQ